MKNNGCMADVGHDLIPGRDSSMGDLKGTAVRSGAVTLGTQAIIFVLTIVSTMVLARLLTPSEHGLMAMVLPFTGLLLLFADLGLSTATIQRAKLTKREASGLFWVNVAIGLVLGISVGLAAPVVAWFYAEPAVAGITMALAIGFPLNGLLVQHKAILRRQLKFTRVAVVDVVSMAMSVLIAVTLAFTGAGYWSLVAMHLARISCSCIGYWLACGWVPEGPASVRGTKELLQFGVNIAGANFFNFVARNIDNVAIGKVHGPAEVGLYSRAYQIMMLPIVNLREPLLRVSLPLLSSLQNDHERYRKMYVEYVSVLAFLSMPLTAFLFAFADELVAVVLGEQWGGAAPMFAFLAVAAFIQVPASSRGTVSISFGLARRYLAWQALNVIAVATGVLIGVNWGGVGVAIAYAMVSWLLLIPSTLLLFRGTPISPLDFYSSVVTPAVASVTMVVLVEWILSHFGSLSAFATLEIAGLLAGPLYLGIWMILPATRRRLKYTLSLVRHLRKPVSTET